MAWNRLREDLANSQPACLSAPQAATWAQLPTVRPSRGSACDSFSVSVQLPVQAQGPSQCPFHMLPTSIAAHTLLPHRPVQAVNSNKFCWAPTASGRREDTNGDFPEASPTTSWTWPAAIWAHSCPCQLCLHRPMVHSPHTMSIGDLPTVSHAVRIHANRSQICPRRSVTSPHVRFPHRNLKQRKIIAPSPRLGCLLF